MSAITPDDYRNLLVPVSSASTDTAKWIIPGVLPPGVVLIAGDPKTYKSTCVLEFIGVLTRRKADFLKDIRLPGRHEKKRVTYLGKEQGPGTLRRVFEQRVMRRPFKKGEEDWDFTASSDPRWRFDAPGSPAHDIPTLIRTWRPDVLICDPLVYFHEQDENDARLVNYIAPSREAALEVGACLIIVHHANKGSSQGGPNDRPWGRIRGTSALWGMADGAFYLSVGAGDLVTVRGEWKEAPPRVWTWRPNEEG